MCRKNSQIHDPKISTKEYAPQTKITDEDIAEAVVACRGNYSSAEIWLQKNKKIFVDRSTISKRVKRDPELTRIKEDAEERRLDKAEAIIDQKLDEGDLGAAKYILSTKGKKRGYTLQQETVISNPEGQSFRFQGVLQPMPADEADKLMDKAFGNGLSVAAGS